LSDADKKSKYDKYGTLDEDEWDYQDFMKNFNFTDIFDIIGEDLLNDPFGLSASKDRHGMQLMYLRKQFEGEEFKPHFEDEKHTKFKDLLPIEIYGSGSGLASTHELMFWVDKEDTDWEEVDENDKPVKDDDEEFDQDPLQEFMEENSKENKTGKLNCNFCKGKKFSYEKLKTHFIKAHKKEYDNSEYSKISTWEKAIEINKKFDDKFEKAFNEEGMDDMDFMFGGNPFGKGQDQNMMKELEKMMMGMLGMPDTKKKKKK
jgi:hypothetical protein